MSFANDFFTHCLNNLENPSASPKTKYYTMFVQQNTFRCSKNSQSKIQLHWSFSGLCLSIHSTNISNKWQWKQIRKKLSIKKERTCFLVIKLQAIIWYVWSCSRSWTGAPDSQVIKIKNQPGLRKLWIDSINKKLYYLKILYTTPEKVKKLRHLKVQQLKSKKKKQRSHSLMKL